jgi:hypothetical protein
VDNCCHFNKLGNEILAEFVAQSILSVWWSRWFLADNLKRPRLSSAFLVL